MRVPASKRDELIGRKPEPDPAPEPKPKRKELTPRDMIRIIQDSNKSGYALVAAALEKLSDKMAGQASPQVTVEPPAVTVTPSVVMQERERPRRFYVNFIRDREGRIQSMEVEEAGGFDA